MLKKGPYKTERQMGERYRKERDREGERENEKGERETERRV